MRTQVSIAAKAFPDVKDLLPNAELPDPFLGSDGKRIRTKREWQRQRKYLLNRVLHYEYGQLPPAPRNVIAEITQTRYLKAQGAIKQTLRLKMGPNHEMDAKVVLTLPVGNGPFPAIIRGDLCWGPIERNIVSAVMKRGYILADFDRLDIAGEGAKTGNTGIYIAYPEFEGGRIAAWAWGFHRVVDYLRTLDIVKWNCIAVTGHSRGGKAALLAGATDERIALTAPNNSGCGGAGCYRLQAHKSEDIAAITDTFPHWFHPRFKEFVGNVDRLPFDQHTVKALIAPRALLSTEALGDRWANPMGTQQSHAAAREVFAFLGVADRIGIRFRKGKHEHNADDWITLLDFADWQLFGKNFFDQAAFLGVANGYSWAAPSR